MAIKNKLLVMSGKGGVGKTTVAVNLACALSTRHKAGILDVDIHGPNVPKMLNLEGKKISSNENKILPIRYSDTLMVMSMGFLLQNKDDSVIWRGPMKHNAIRQFVQDVDWGDLDYLIIDFPPGTGDEAISVFQVMKGITGSIIVSTPQEVSLLDISKSIDFCRKANINIIGLIENMSSEIFGRGTVKEFAKKKGVSYLGSLDLNKEISVSGDTGKPFYASGSPNSRSFNEIVEKIITR